MDTGLMPKKGAITTGASRLSFKAERQLVVFSLAGEDYGVDIGTVREIIRLQEVTKVPKTPKFIEGIISLRGKVIPVIDMRKRLDVAPTGDPKENRIVVVDVGGQDIGVVVDSVAEVLRIPIDSVEPPSDIITGSDSEYLLGIAKLPSRLIILLDLQKLFSAKERTQLSKISTQRN